MNPKDRQDSAPANPLAQDDLPQALITFSEEMDRQSRPRFEELLRRVARELLANEDAAQEAIASGGFRVGDTTLVVRFNDDNHQIELFADIGLPEPHAQAQTHRLALERNLCRTYPSVMLGVHPDSGRLVATTSVHLLLLTDDSMCLHAMETLAHAAAELRAAFGGFEA